MEEGFAGFGAAAGHPQLGVEKQELLPPALLSLVHLVSMLDTGEVPGLPDGKHHPPPAGQGRGRLACLEPSAPFTDRGPRTKAL